MGSLQQYFSVYQFPTGRRLFAMRQTAQLAARLGLTEIQRFAEQAVEQAQRTAALEASWRRSRSTQVGRRKRAGSIDAELDRCLGGLAKHLDSMVHTFGDEGIGARAGQLLASILPEGPAAITHMSYENELAAAEVVLRDLKEKHAEAVVALGLVPFVERLAALVSQFREALTEESVREISYDQIRQAQAEGQEAMLRVVAKMIADFPGTSPEQTARRQELLAPIQAQNRRLSERYASRRGLSDIDPQTGEELPEVEPTPAEPPGGASAGA